MRRCFAGLIFVGLCLAQSGGEATLSGRITDAATHQPIEGAAISSRGGRGAKPASAVSDASGAYSMRLPAAERVSLEISKEGYSTLDLRSTDSTEVRLKAGGSETRNFELSRPGSLSGHLVDRDSGKPLQGFYIHAIRWYAGLENSTGFRYPAFPTGADGAFSIANLPPASYVMVVDPPMGGKIRVPEKDQEKKDEAGYGPTWYPGVPRPEMASPVVIGYGEDRRIDMQLRKHDMLHIAGTVDVPENMKNYPVTFTLVTEEKGRPTGAEGQIPRAGPFRIDGLEEGSYRVLVAHQNIHGANLGYGGKAVTLAGHSVDDLKIELRPGVSLRVEVKMAEEKAEAPRNFYFVPLSLDGWGPMDDGDPPGSPARMTRTGLPPGRYNLATMQIPGYAVVSRTLNGTPVPPGAPLDLESPESLLTIVLTSTPGSITGTVRDSEQQAVAGATVMLSPESFGGGGLPLSDREVAVSDGNGRFTISGLAPGRYQAIAMNGEDRRGTMDTGAIAERLRMAEAIVVEAGKSTSVDVTVGK